MAMMGAMCTMIDIFNKYSGKEGDPLTLNKAELKELLEKELGETTSAKDHCAVDKIFSGLDTNKDEVIDFKEYMTMVACLTMLCHEFFTGCGEQQQQKKE